MKPGAFGSCDKVLFSLCVRTLRGSPPKWCLESPRDVNNDHGGTCRNAGNRNINTAIDSQGHSNALCFIDCERDVVGLHLITSLNKIYHDRLVAENGKM